MTMPYFFYFVQGDHIVNTVPKRYSPIEFGLVSVFLIIITIPDGIHIFINFHRLIDYMALASILETSNKMTIHKKETLFTIISLTFL